MIHCLPQLEIPDASPLAEALRRTSHLGIGAHPDDLEFFTYPAIEACHGHPDHWFGGVVVTDGAGCARSGPYAGFSDAEMAQLRHNEQSQAAQIGAYSFISQLGFRSSDLDIPEKRMRVVDQLEALLLACRPKELFLHQPMDRHPTHLKVLSCCIEALRRLPLAKVPDRILGCEGWGSLDWIAPDQRISLRADAHPELAERLLEIFRSQIEGGKNYAAATLGRRLSNATFDQSHDVDAARMTCYAIDLRPLINDPKADLTSFAEGHILAFRDQTLQTIRSSINC
jgi:LmbE family N-acetylglucosaminyl deacetylase